MRFKLMLFVIAGLTFSVGLAVLPSRAEARTAADPTAFSCLGLCWKCSFVNDKWESKTSTYPELANDTDTNTACGHHVKCADECSATVLPTAAELSRYVARADIVEFAKLLARAPIIEVNLKRRAVQVIGCQGTIVASIPLSDELLVAAAPYSTRAYAHVE